MMGGMEDGMTGGMEDGMTGGMEDGMTGGMEDGMTGGMEDGMEGGMEGGMGGMEGGLGGMEGGMGGMGGGSQSAPKTLAEFASQSFAAGNDKQGIELTYAAAIVDDNNAAILSKYRWVDAIDQPALAVRMVSVLKSQRAKDSQEILSQLGQNKNCHKLEAIVRQEIQAVVQAGLAAKAWKA